MFRVLKHVLKSNLLPRVSCVHPQSIGTYGEAPDLKEGKSYRPPLLRPEIPKDEAILRIKVPEFVERRMRLLSFISGFESRDGLCKNHLVIIPSAAVKIENEVAMPFRQDENFVYLTGCMEPDACLLIMLLSDNVRTVMMVQPKDDMNQYWEGKRTGVDMAPVRFGVDESYPFQHFHSFLNGLLKTDEKLMFWFDEKSCRHPQIRDLMERARLKARIKEFISPSYLIQKMRIKKSPTEVQILREACKITGQSVQDAMAICRPGINEGIIQQKIDIELRRRGAEKFAYPPSIAGGTRGLNLTYTANDKVIERGELIVVDVGAEYNTFSTDITRTFPVSGKFSSSQKVLYNALLRTNEKIIKHLAGNANVTIDTLYTKMCAILAKELYMIGFKKNISIQDLAKEIRVFCPHHVAHHVGMDVRDTPLIHRTTALQPGMVVAIEPGLYVPETRTDVAPMFRGLAMRIEDNILLTELGPEILTCCAKTIQEIEAVVGSKEAY